MISNLRDFIAPEASVVAKTAAIQKIEPSRTSTTKQCCAGDGNEVLPAKMVDARERMRLLEEETARLEKAYASWRIGEPSSSNDLDGGPRRATVKSATALSGKSLRHSLSTAFLAGSSTATGSAGPTIRPFTSQWPMPYVVSYSLGVSVTFLFFVSHDVGSL